MAMIAVAAVVVFAGVYAATRTVSVPGQKLGEIAVQTAKEGEPRIIVWGIVRPIGGNLLAVQEPPRIERRKQKSGGKGGGGSSTRVEIPRRTYAVGICEGPITGIRRVWRNNKLVYNVDSQWGRKTIKGARFYLGGWDQMPDPSLEMVFGVGNVPAMRGTAYMVMHDEDLQDTGGAVPQWIFEVERAEGYALTSRPYPIEDFENIQAPGAELRLTPGYEGIEGADSAGAAIASGEMKALLRAYSVPSEEIDAAGATLAAGELRVALNAYTVAPEGADSAGAALMSGALQKLLINYDRYAPEGADSAGATLIGGAMQ